MSDLIKRNDAIKAINKYWINGTSLCRADCLEEHIKAMPSVDRPQEWIPCSEKLPIGSGKYLVQATNHNGIGSYMEVVTYQSQNWMMDGVAVAWMPLPEPWKGAGDE